VLNLADVTAVDSTGIGALVAARTSVARAGGQLRLLGLTRRIQDLVVISGLLSYFAVLDSEADLASGDAGRREEVGTTS
jgi:anti-sigma B factor antagonist